MGDGFAPMPVQADVLHTINRGIEMMKNVRALIAAMMIALLCQATSEATPINYGDFFGAPGQSSFLDVTEDSPTDGTPLFEAPTLLPNSLFFSPLLFTSTANDGSADTTTGILTMIVEVEPGLLISELVIGLTADTTLLGVGTADTFSSIATTVAIQDLDPGIGGVQTFDVTYTPAKLFELPDDNFVEVAGNLTVDLTGAAIRRLALTIGHSISTGSENMTTSFIQAKSLDIDVSTIPVPEPATGLVLLVGGLMARRRRK